MMRVLSVCVFVHERGGHTGQGHEETGKSTGPQNNKQTRTQAALIKPSLVLVMRSGAPEQQTSLSCLTDCSQSPGAGPDLCSVQQHPYTPRPFVFPPQLSQTGRWLFHIHLAAERTGPMANSYRDRCVDFGLWCKCALSKSSVCYHQGFEGTKTGGLITDGKK